MRLLPQFVPVDDAPRNVVIFDPDERGNGDVIRVWAARSGLLDMNAACEECGAGFHAPHNREGFGVTRCPSCAHWTQGSRERKPPPPVDPLRGQLAVVCPGCAVRLLAEPLEPVRSTFPDGTPGDLPMWARGSTHHVPAWAGVKALGGRALFCRDGCRKRLERHTRGGGRLELAIGAGELRLYEAGGAAEPALICPCSPWAASWSVLGRHATLVA